MNEVYVVSYFYPDGTYAGITGVYDSEFKANAVMQLLKLNDYPDCTFIITHSTVD